MNYQALKPILRQTGPKNKDFDLVDDSLAGIRCIPACISAYIEKVQDQYRTVALFDIADIENQTLSSGQSIVYMHPEEIAYKKAGPALRANLRYVRDWLGEGDCDPSFSDPIDAALAMVEPHLEDQSLEPHA